MNVTLESLDLSPDQLRSSRELIEKMAYANWIEAGSPDGRHLEFWVQAERCWIERYYVPQRPLDGTRPPVARTPELSEAFDGARPDGSFDDSASPDPVAARCRQTVNAQ